MPSPSTPSARVLANRRARVQMHRDSLDELTRRMADGLLGVGIAIAEDASASAPRDPEAAARREVPMMADTWVVQVWALGKRAGGAEASSMETWSKKPRGVTIRKDEAVVTVGFTSPISHFAELGTVKERARPFLTPALARHLGDIGPGVKRAMAKNALRKSERAAREAVR